MRNTKGNAEEETTKGDKKKSSGEDYTRSTLQEK